MIRRNKNMNEFEEKINQTNSQFLQDFSQWNSKIKNDMIEISKKYHPLLDEMKNENKLIKKGNEVKYIMEKEETEKMNIETDDVKLRREEKIKYNARGKAFDLFLKDYREQYLK